VIPLAGSGKPTIEYSYDAMGNRISKKEIYSSQTKTTAYVYNASGVLMAVYEDAAISEMEVYGSGRVGSYRPGSGLFFEITNHLGSVAAVVKDTRKSDGSVDIVSLNDYYPGGMDMPGRSFTASDYKFGYQGSLKASELGSNQYTTFFREMDCRIMRWWNPDPVYQPEQSPYCMMDGNPITFNDFFGDQTRFDKKTGLYGKNQNNTNRNESAIFKSNLFPMINNNLGFKFKLSDVFTITNPKPITVPLKPNGITNSQTDPFDIAKEYRKLISDGKYDDAVKLLVGYYQLDKGIEKKYKIIITDDDNSGGFYICKASNSPDEDGLYEVTFSKAFLKKCYFGNIVRAIDHEFYHIFQKVVLGLIGDDDAIHCYREILAHHRSLFRKGIPSATLKQKLSWVNDVKEYCRRLPNSLKSEIIKKEMIDIYKLGDAIKK
jgi:RHS repeat-associated protein